MAGQKKRAHILCHIPESVELDLSTEGGYTGSGVSRLDSESPRFPAKPISREPQTCIHFHIPESVELDLSAEGRTGSHVSRLERNPKLPHPPQTSNMYTPVSVHETCETFTKFTGPSVRQTLDVCLTN